MASGLDYLTQQPAAPVQGALSAAAPTQGAGVPTQGELDQYRQSFLADQAQRMQNFGAYVQANPFIEMSGTAGRDERFRFQPNLDNRPLQLMMDGELLGTGTTDEERNALVERARALSAEGDKSRTVQLLRQTGSPVEQGGLGYFYSPVYDDAPDPDGLGDFLLKTVLPIAVSFIPGIGPALGAKLGLKGLAAKAIGAGLASGIGRTAGGVLSGDPLGESLKAGLTSGALTGLTAGALGGLGGAKGSVLGGAKGSALGLSPGFEAARGAAGSLVPAATGGLDDLINVVANSIGSGSGGALGSAIAGGVGSVGSNLLQPQTQQAQIGTPEPGLDILANRFPTGSAFPGAAAGVSGAGQTALDILAQQPQQQAPQEQAPTEMEEIGTIVDRYPDAVPTGALASLPDVIAQAIAQQPQQTPQEQAPETTEDEIVVTGSGYKAPTGGLSGAVSSAVNNLLTQPQLPDPGANEMLVEANPIDDPAIGPPVNLFEQLQNPMINDATTDPAEPEKTPLQKALTTGGRILTGLSILGGLAGGGGRNASGLGTGAAAIGTRASLDPVFGGQLPPARGIFAQGSSAPRVMGDIDYERYGYGPARSFFENVPETPEQYRAALAANAPRPMVAGAGTVGVPNFLSNFIPPTAGSPALQAVRRLAPGVSDAQIEAFLATPEGADFLAAIQEAETPQGAARGGAMAVKGRGKPSRDSYAVNGVGSGRSDEIPALLSDGEYVMDAETVALLGNGSGKAGAKQLDDLRVKIRKHKGRNLAKGRFSDNAKAPEKYLSGGRT